MKQVKEALRKGDLVRNKSTGKLYIVTAVGDSELSIWIMLAQVGESDKLGDNEIVYLSQYFELVSKAGTSIAKKTT